MFPIDNTIWKAVIDTMQEGLMLVDCDGKITFVNPAFENLLGYSQEELLNQSCAVLQCDSCFRARADGLDSYCALFKEGDVHSSECIFRHKDGSARHLLKNAVVIRDNAGKIIGGVETLTDLSRVVAGEQMINSLKKELKRDQGFAGIVGESSNMQQVFDLTASAADSDAPVVIYGESGTGKELLANALHQLSPRADKPFIKVNCAALNENLLESELFGHIKGAFTGADYKRIGRFEAANGGSIFLDEIGDLPMSTQTKLLRVLQEKEIERVGDHRPIKVDVRIITATHKDLQAMIEAEQFREDIFFRINVVPINLPPLRERGADIPLLAQTFIKNIRRKTGKKIKGIDNTAVEQLCRYPWPGNIRELINAIEYAFVVCQGEKILLKHLPIAISREFGQAERSSQPPISQKNSGKKEEILAALKRNNWNRALTAESLNVSRVTLWKWMKQHEII